MVKPGNKKTSYNNSSPHWAAVIVVPKTTTTSLHTQAPFINQRSPGWRCQGVIYDRLCLTGDWANSS